MNFFTNKLIIITGGGSGLGLQLATLICSYRGRVVILGTSVEKLIMTQKKILTLYPDASIFFYLLDVTRHEASDILFKKIYREHGDIHGVFINAGQVFNRDFRWMPVSKIQQIIDTNVYGAMYTTKAALPYLAESNAFLAFTSSIAGLLPAPEASVYSASKAALLAFARCLQLELIPRGVNVLIFNPGFFQSNFIQGAIATPGLMPVEKVANIYLRAIINKKTNVTIPFYMTLGIFFWRFLLFTGIGIFLCRLSTKRLHKFYGNGKPSINPQKETFIQDGFGFRRFLCALSFNKRMADWLHRKFKVQR